MEKTYVVGTDAGTTGARTVIFTAEGKEVGSAYFETPTRFPQPGWVEQDAEDVVNLAYRSTKTAIEKSGIDPADIAAISFTNMRSTCVPVDANGQYLSHIFIWQDLRGTEMIPWMRERLAANGMTEMDLYNITGFPISAVPPSSKIYWYKKHFPELYEKTDTFITPQAMLLRAYGAKDDWYDDNTDAGWWQIANADTFEYDERIAEIFGVDVAKYPNNYRPGTQVGTVTPEVASLTGLLAGTPLILGSGDQQCGAIGVGNAEEGLASVSLGTAGLCIGYSSKPIRHPEGANHILGHPGTGHWQMEGHASAAASAFRWLRDSIGQLERTTASVISADVYDLFTRSAEGSPPGAKGAIFLPWLAGAACPYYDSYARAAFVGMTFAHDKGDLVRAAMEGIAFEMRDMLEALKQGGLPDFKYYRVTGGAARSPLWNQIQADIYNGPVETVETSEATALGAAILAAMGVGIYSDVHEAIGNMVHVADRWDPIPENVETYDEIFGIFRNTYKALKTDVFPAISRFQGVA
ncbi:FGGY-family carbohydrate kinase [Propionicicella superfundia]|uniref:FGGY-family carbohydrate kinase n=1 Tax=Propionicicella superfundia TaxID=348582 RepID=UPI00041024CF|nr:FGGY family carbohydrate kinase [Propionicicella superfundia]